MSVSVVFVRKKSRVDCVNIKYVPQNNFVSKPTILPSFA